MAGIIEKMTDGKWEGGYPRAVPSSCVYDGSKIYFHCAGAGHKLAARYSPDDEAGREKEIEREFSAVCMVEMTIDHMTGKQAVELMREKRAAAVKIRGQIRKGKCGSGKDESSMDETSRK